MDMYCKVFVDSEADQTQLLLLVARITSGSIDTGTVDSPDLEAYLDANDDFDDVKRLQGPDQFLFYRYYFDVDPTDTTTRERYVQSVGQLLEGLWQARCKAVAACDFENELPRGGAYIGSSED